MSEKSSCSMKKCRAPLLSSFCEKRGIPPFFLLPKNKEGASKSWMPQHPSCQHPLSSLLFRDFFEALLANFWTSKKRLLCWLCSKKLEKKSSSQRKKDQERRWVFFLMCSLEKKEFFFQFFFIFFLE